MPAQWCVRRPRASTAVSSLHTMPAPPIANCPRCTRGQSVRLPSLARYCDIGPSMMRLRAVTPRIVIGRSSSGRWSTGVRSPPGRSVTNSTPAIFIFDIGYFLDQRLFTAKRLLMSIDIARPFAHQCDANEGGKIMNGAAVIAEILKREGTGFLSGYPRNPLIEACAALDVRTILCRQERVGVGIADGYSRISRGKRNGVFAAQAGPGIENAFPGIAQAFAENVPGMVIPATLPLARHYLKPVLRAADVYRPVTKWSALAPSVQELPDLMRRAYHAMRSGKGGPVLIEVPPEVWEAEYKGDLDYTPMPMQRTAPDPDAVKEAVRMLLGAKRPLVCGGAGVHYAEAGDRLAALAELIPAPV